MQTICMLHSTFLTAAPRHGLSAPSKPTDIAHILWWVLWNRLWFAIIKGASAPDRSFPISAECVLFLFVQINLYAQLHRFGVYPPNQTAYGTPRSFQAMIANVATSNTTALEKMTGTLTFQDGENRQLCNATLANNNTMSGTQVRVARPLTVAAMASCVALSGEAHQATSCTWQLAQDRYALLHLTLGEGAIP